MKTIYTLIITILFFVRCNSTETQNKQASLIVEKKYFPNGNIRAEASYNKDSLKHGYGKLFYESGILKLELEYLNGRKDGIEKGYFPNGKLKYKGFNKNNHLIGEQKDYFENSKLKLYSFYDPVGRGVYRAKYDSTGQLISEEGSLKSYIVVRTTADFVFMLGDTLDVKIYVPNPPRLTKNLRLKILDEKQNEISSKTLSILNGMATYQDVLLNHGKYFLVSNIEYQKDSFTTELSFEVLKP